MDSLVRYRKLDDLKNKSLKIHAVVEFTSTQQISIGFPLTCPPRPTQFFALYSYKQEINLEWPINETTRIATWAECAKQ